MYITARTLSNRFQNLLDENYLMQSSVHLSQTLTQLSMHMTVSE
jgi:hypothetical protein